MLLTMITAICFASGGGWWGVGVGGGGSGVVRGAVGGG